MSPADRGILTATLDASSAGTAARLKYIRALIHTGGDQVAFTQPFPALVLAASAIVSNPGIG